MENSQSSAMSRRGALGTSENSSASSGRIGTASRLSALNSMSNRLGTAKSIGIPQKVLTERPLTQQQGLSGISSYGRIGTSSVRQVKDKRYWLALLQTKIQEIAQESEKLKKEKKNLDRETSAKKLYEKKVKEQAKELSILHSKLSEMNLALDSTTSGATRQQLQNETIVFREKNEVMQNQLEQIFKDRQNREQQNQQLEDSNESEKNKINELIYSLNSEDQNKYREYQHICEKLKSENSEIHFQIEETMRQKEKLSAVVVNSQSRLEAVKLHSKLKETIAKRNQLKNEEINRLTPAQEREKLISEVRQNNQAISSINKQLSIISNQLKEKRDYMQQIDQDLEEGNSERFIKFKELKKRDEIMSNFMETFQLQMSKEKKNIESLKNQITFAIEQITLQGLSSKVNSNTKISASILNDSTHNLTSHEGLIKEYSKLQIQLKQLKILEKRIEKQYQDLKVEEMNSLQDIQKYNNLKALRDEFSLKYEEISTILQELRDKKRVTENVVKDAEKRNQSVKDKLRSNETYRQISHMEEKLSDLIKDNKNFQAAIDELKKEYDFSEVKKFAQQKVDDYNKILCEDLRSSENKF